MEQGSLAKFVHFKTKSEYLKAQTEGRIKPEQLCFIKEVNAISTHEEMYNYVNWVYIGFDLISDSEQKILYDSENKQLIKLCIN